MTHATAQIVPHDSSGQVTCLSVLTAMMSAGGGAPVPAAAPSVAAIVTGTDGEEHTLTPRKMFLEESKPAA